MQVVKFLVVILVLLMPIAASAQDYVGDQVCSRCHGNYPEEGFFAAYENSGHPYKLNKVVDGEPPEWPHTDPPPLPTVGEEQVTWDDVTYVIGNFYWKARFIGTDGYIITGGEDDLTQWNVQNETWVGYHPGEQRPYNCGRCHTTGYNPEGNQDDLEGLVGTWTEPGIRCEACHGPGSEHADRPQQNLPPGGLACSECHYRDSEFRMPWKGGFIRHHQQAEGFSHSPHYGQDEFAEGCNTCHDPHKSTLYELGGLREAATCTNCHTERETYLVDEMENLECIDCHMPAMAKSAVAWNAHKGDVRGHLFAITTEPILATANLDTIDDVTYWHQEDDGRAYITLDYACMGCHVDEDIEELAEYADDIHENHPARVGDDTAELPTSTSLGQAYPNPFNSESRISYNLRLAGDVKLTLYNTTGRRVATLVEGFHEAGRYEAVIHAGDMPSGVYIVNMEFPGLQLNRKVVLTR